jgi:DNA topoisomerase-2
MLLVNGARGIGTGYSTFIPPCDVKLLLTGLQSWLKKEKKVSEIQVVPAFRGFQGKIVPGNKEYIVQGIWKVEKDVMTITELPIETWISDYKEYLDGLETAGTIKDYTDMSTDVTIHFKIKLTGNPEHLATIEKSLISKLKLTNMHAFNSECVIHKYDTLHEILEEFTETRLELYGKRKEHMLSLMNAKLPYHTNVVRFILQQSQEVPKPDLRRRTQEECDVLLTNEKFEKLDDSYSYLMDLPIKSITSTVAQKHQTELDSLRKKISELENQTPESLWLEDLQTFSKNYGKGI